MKEYEITVINLMEQRKMEENVKVLERIRNSVYRKKEEALSAVQQNPELLETAEAAISFINIPQYMIKIDMRRAFLLFNYCGFPKEEWEDMYYQAVWETQQSSKYFYINPEDIEKLADEE